MYKQHLNIIVRYINQEVPGSLEMLGWAHNIPDILQEIENESRKKVDQERQESKGKFWVPLRALKTSWKLKFREANSQTAGTGRGDEMRGEDERMLSRPRPKAGILRLLGKQ